MPVSTRRQHLRRPARPHRSATPSVPTPVPVPYTVQNMTSTSAQTVPMVPTVPTVTEFESNPTRAQQMTRDPKISKFAGSANGLPIEAFLNIFDYYFSSLEDSSKVRKIGEYLDGDALAFFGTDIISEPTVSWHTTKDRLIHRYGHTDIPPILAAMRRKLQRNELIKDYFDDKCRYLRLERGLSEEARTHILTEGLPDAYRQHFYGRRFASTTEWLKTAQDIEADRLRSTQSSRPQTSSHFTRTDAKPRPQSSNISSKRDKSKPPYACKICRDRGETAYHWHNECPHNPKRNDSHQRQDSHSNKEHENIQMLAALVTPNLDEDLPILIPARIKSFELSAFVDTGANINIIPDYVARDLNLTIDRRNARPIRMAKGFAQTLGSVSFSLTIAGIIKTIDALVLKDFEYTLLLSRKTCQEFKICIDTENMTARVKESGTRCHVVNKTQTLCIPSSKPLLDSHCIPCYAHDIQSLVKTYNYLFAADSTDLGRINIEKHRILLSDNEPIALRPYRQSTSNADETARQVRELLAKGLIRESTSPYAAPITLADKKDGSKRLCVDYRLLNQKTVSDKTPLPIIADVIDRLQGYKVFSKLDFASGYWQVAVYEPDIAKTAFVTRDGHYEWLVLPFGLKNSPSTFHRVVRKAIGDLHNNGVMSYLDDIIVYSKDIDEHYKLLKELFTRLSQHNARLRLDKCQFAQSSIEFLGHLMNGSDVRPPDSKIKAIVGFPQPTNHKEVERFHGLVNYVREYIPDFAQLSAPLTQLLRKSKKFVWAEPQQKAFESLKEILTKGPVRHIYDQRLECQLHTDASTIGIAGVLIQDGHPIGYYSRKLSDAETRYTVTEQECLALVDSIKYFRIYLEGVKFKVYTDHKALKWLINFESTKKRLYRWSQELSLYTFEVIHRPGREMSHVLD